MTVLNTRDCSDLEREPGLVEVEVAPPDTPFSTAFEVEVAIATSTSSALNTRPKWGLGRTDSHCNDEGRERCTRDEVEVGAVDVRGRYRNRRNSSSFERSSTADAS